MMKKMFFILSLLVISVIVGLQVSKDPGYVLISYGMWTLEMPLWLSTTLISLLFLLCFFSIKGIEYFYTAINNLSIWLSYRKTKKARQDSLDGYLALAEGHWKKAEKLLLQGTLKQSTALINYIGAAIAAEEQGNHQKREDYLRLALLTSSRANTAIEITQARLQHQSGQFEQCLATLQHLHNNYPHHEYVLKLLKEVSIRLKDWPLLQKIIPNLKRLNLISEAEELFLLKKIYSFEIGKFSKISPPKDALTLFWKNIPSTLKKDPQILNEFCNLYAIHYPLKVEKILRQAIQNSLDEKLILLYGKLNPELSKIKLSFFEQFLSEHSDNTTLLLTIGKLCVEQNLWGKAEQYLLDALKNEPNPIAHNELGHLYLITGEEGKASHHFQQGLLLSLEEPPK